MKKRDEKNVENFTPKTRKRLLGRNTHREQDCTDTEEKPFCLHGLRLIWISVQATDTVLWTRKETFGFLKRQGFLSSLVTVSEEKSVLWR
jgi:hypothetical protein